MSNVDGEECWLHLRRQGITDEEFAVEHERFLAMTAEDFAKLAKPKKTDGASN